MPTKTKQPKTDSMEDKRWNIIKILFLARREKGISQEELGKLLGITAMGISYIEHGKRDIRLVELIKMADILGYSLELKQNET